MLSRVADRLGSGNIEHRFERRVFSVQDNDPAFPWLGCSIAELEDQDAIFVIGSNIRQEAPILAHRIRKAALGGASVSFASAAEHEYFFDVDHYLSGAGLVDLLSGKGVEPIFEKLRKADNALVLLGNIAGRHGSFSAVRALAAEIAEKAGAKLGTLSPGANSAGLSLAGVLPRGTEGRHAGAMLDDSLDTVMLLGVEPDADIHATEDAVAKLAKQQFVISLTPFVSDALLKSADLLLPVGTFAETSGTYVNVEGTWQSFAGVANPVGEARPAWKVLRVLGNLVDADGFVYVTSEDVLEECKSGLGDVVMESFAARKAPTAKAADSSGDEIDTPLYSVDGLVRRATALQLTPEARRAAGQGGD